MGDNSLFLYRVNEYLHSKIEEERAVNNIHMFTYKGDSKLSVTLKPLLEKENKYHGLHPKVNIEYLINFISSEDNNVNDAECFWRNIFRLQENHGLMNLIIDEGEDISNLDILKNLDFIKVLLGRAILQMSSHLGFKIKISDEGVARRFIDRVYSEWIKRTDYFDLFADNISKEKNLFWKYDSSIGEIWLLGIWPIDIIDSLDKEYSIEVDRDDLVLKKLNVDDTGKVNLFRIVLTFGKDYLKYFDLYNNNVYYSGVMPKVRKIIYPDSKFLNDVKNIRFDVVKTTFATIDLMDNPLIISHPYFKQDMEKYDLMRRFDNYEDIIQQKYLYSDIEKENSDDYESKNVEKINKYLANTLNTNTIAVSANIITSDEILIVGKRADSSIDSGECYCSVNGQSEFRDENVDFYYKSVYEDLPSLEYGSKYRVDLDDEIRREVIAELGICNLNSTWDYYGASYLSKNNFPEKSDENIGIDESSKVKNRRMHFNVLSSNKTDLSYKEVLKSSKNAVEKFENSKILGFKLSVFVNIFGRMKSHFHEFIKWLLNNNSNIFLVILCLSIIFNKRKLTFDDLERYVEFVILIIYLLTLLKKWYDDKNIRSLMVKVNCKSADKYDEIFRQIIGKYKGKGKSDLKLHAIFYLTFILFIEDKQRVLELENVKMKK